MRSPRWWTIEESGYPWEREALAFLREHLPDSDPWRAWGNFEFIDDAGRVNEVDLLVMSPSGLFLIEIKSRPGDVTGDSHTWTWITNGRPHTRDNPLLLANRKAKRLAGLLKQQPSIAKAKVRVPFVQEAIFLSARQVKLRLPEILSRHVLLRGRPGDPKDYGIIAALSGSDQARPPAIDRSLARTIGRAVEEAGIRPSQRQKRVGDYELGRLLAEGDSWQDFDGKHVSANVHRRIRVYPFAKATSEPARATLTNLASREFRLLQDIDHPGVLRVLDFKESERGPALIFDHDPNAVRLDFVLSEHGSKLTVEARLHFIRQLAEILRYAHEKRLYHRGLSPQCILVRDFSRSRPRLQIMDWHTAVREGSSSGSPGATSGTLHPEDHVEDPARVYLAPEAWQGTAPSGAYHDVFSLGAVTYHVFAGIPPAASPLDLMEKLRTGNGLQLSDVLDGTSLALQELVRLSTHPDVSLRIASMDEFLARLAEVEKELSLPPAEPTVDPAHAKAGDRVEAGFIVVERLGRGASADALLVSHDGSDERLVLKVAIDTKHNDRLKGESEVLAKLRHSNIVSLRETLTIAGRTALLLDRAGEETLAQRLRKERPSLDLVRRFGEELMGVIDYLEQEGIAHRDVKPDNIGIAPTGQKGQLRLVLFDFSLARTPVDNIRAGTPPYVDPFLSLRRPPRWDLAAERYATAVTLYEMVTARTPVWGDGRSDPALLDCEVTIDVECFDPNLRDGFVEFFAKALRRDPRERYDNVEEMLRAWRHVFDSARTTTFEGADFSAVARLATATTPVTDLGYSVEALNVLDRMGIHTVRQLLAVDRIKFRYLTNVGDRVRKEIRLKAKELANLRRDLVPGQPSVVNGDDEHGIAPSIDRLAEQLLPRRPAGVELAEDRAMATYLGLEGDAAVAWVSIGETLRPHG
jgi:serine/threonine protein kinase